MDTTLSDQTTVINALTTRIRELEGELARQRTEQRHALPAQIEGIFRWMRARSVIPLYVGSGPDEEAKAAFVGDVGCHLMSDAVAAKALEQVWFLSGAPMSEEAKNALRQAAHHGMSRW